VIAISDQCTLSRTFAIPWPSSARTAEQLCFTFAAFSFSPDHRFHFVGTGHASQRHRSSRHRGVVWRAPTLSPTLSQQRRLPLPNTVMLWKPLKLVCASGAKVSLPCAYNTLTAELECGNSLPFLWSLILYDPRWYDHSGVSTGMAGNTRHGE